MTQLETVHNTGKSTTSGVSLLSRLLVVFFAAMVSLALPAIALAQQSAKPGQQTQGVIVARLLANAQPHSGKIYHLTGP